MFCLHVGACLYTNSVVVQFSHQKNWRQTQQSNFFLKTLSQNAQQQVRDSVLVWNCVCVCVCVHASERQKICTCAFLCGDSLFFLRKNERSYELEHCAPKTKVPRSPEGGQGVHLALKTWCHAPLPCCTTVRLSLSRCQVSQFAWWSVLWRAQNNWVSSNWE